jgi:hypothetical protein
MAMAEVMLKGVLHDYSGAIPDFSKSTELDPNQSDAYQRGDAKAKLQDQVGAVNDYTKAMN